MEVKFCQTEAQGKMCQAKKSKLITNNAELRLCYLVISGYTEALATQC